MHGAYHLKSDVDHLHLRRRISPDGWVEWGLYKLLMSLNLRKGLFANYLYNTGDYILQCARDVLQIQLMGTKDEHVPEVRHRRLLRWRGKSLHGEF